MINPSETLISMQERNLSDIRFPLIFKICIKPGFNETEVMNLGYSTSWSEAKKLASPCPNNGLNAFCENTPIVFFLNGKKVTGETGHQLVLNFGFWVSYEKKMRTLTNRSMTVSNKALKKCH